MEKLLLLFPSPKANINDLLLFYKNKNQIKDSDVVVCGYFSMAYFPDFYKKSSFKSVINSYKSILKTNYYQPELCINDFWNKFMVLKFSTPISFLKEDKIFISYKFEKLTRYIFNLLKTSQVDIDFFDLKEIIKNIYNFETGDINTTKLKLVIDSFELSKKEKKLIATNVIKKRWLKEYLGYMECALFVSTVIIFSKAKEIYLPKDKIYYYHLAEKIYQYNVDMLKFPDLPECIPLESYNLPDIKGYGVFANPDQQIFLDDDFKTIEKKVFGIKSDTNKAYKTDAGNPDKCVVFTYLRAFVDKLFLTHIHKSCKNGSIGCVECRKILFTHYIFKF